MKTDNSDMMRAVVLGAVAFLALSAPAVAQNGLGRGMGTTSAGAVQPLTASETEWLTFMHEEEKLARDIYQQLYQKWNLATFQNIAGSEQRHYDSIGVLLTRCGVADPAQYNAAGVFTNAALNQLYNQLLAKGTQSVQDALEVGALIEKKDIADLEAALKDTTKADLKRVFTNLMSGSYRHLDAFESGCAAATARAAVIQ